MNTWWKLMSLIDELRASRQSSATAHLQFLQNQKYGGIHAFMEGNSDPSFYRAAILRFHSDFNSIFIYDCGGKKGVYKLREKINSLSEGGSIKKFQITILYFVDKDIAEIIPEAHPHADDVYITDHYSIENYLVSRYVFDTILTDCFSFTKGTLPDKQRFLDLFENQLQAFYDHVAPVMAWGLYLIRHKVDFKFDDIKLGRLLKFDDELNITFGVQGDFGHLIQALEDMCKVHTPPEFISEEKAIVSELKGYPPKQFIRGKFEIWFLLKFSEAVKQLLKKLPSIEFRYSEALMSEKDIVKFLAPRLHPLPESLEHFLATRISTKSY
jgi:hypothetical protein